MHSPVVSSKFESKELACDDCSALSVVPDWGQCMVCTSTSQVNTTRDLSLNPTLMIFQKQKYTCVSCDKIFKSEKSWRCTEVLIMGEKSNIPPPKS